MKKKIVKKNKIVNLEAFTPWVARDYYELANSSQDISIYVPGLVEDSFPLTSMMVNNFAKCDFLTEFAFVITDSFHTPVGALLASQNLVLNSLDVYYFIGAQHRHKGYMRAALKEFVAYAKATTPYHNLIFDVRVDNEKSQRLLESLGCRNLGITNWYAIESYFQYELEIK